MNGAPGRALLIAWYRLLASTRQPTCSPNLGARGGAVFDRARGDNTTRLVGACACDSPRAGSYAVVGMCTAQLLCGRLLQSEAMLCDICALSREALHNLSRSRRRALRAIDKEVRA